MTAQQRQSASGKVIFLLAPNFEEGPAIYCLARLREAGIAASSVGVSAGLIGGAHGIAVRPDYTLGQLSSNPPPQIIFIPDGKKSVSTLLADPRVHRLLAATLDNSGTIAAMPEAASLVNHLEMEGKTNTVLTQPNGSLDEFANRLINLVIS
jgi:putative intracellular protease/amidase